MRIGLCPKCGSALWHDDMDHTMICCSVNCAWKANPVEQEYHIQELEKQLNTLKSNFQMLENKFNIHLMLH